jgi:hypothetical protein
MREYHFHEGKAGAALAIRVTPRAKRNEIIEVQADGTVKIHLTAPPVEGKANQALIEFLAEVLDIPTSKIEIIAGTSGRNKLISILGMDAQTVQQKILAKLS